MRLFNTMSQTVEEATFPDGKAGLYVCGVTPYDTAHLGHAFVFATFDTLVRILRHDGLNVTYVQNVTDIDDPLFEKARSLGNLSWRELADRETTRFLDEMAAINVRKPDHYVKASDELPAMFALIQRLLERGKAYSNDGWIYFSVRSDPEYAQLAAAVGIEGRDALLRVANQNGNNPDDPRKHDPLDFLLWRGEEPGEPAWDSPFGRGRPGWHIECSAMSTRYLGPQLDIHGGGTDLIFPHHSSEIAQSEGASGVQPFVRYWMHVGMVALDGQKMSKSLGNLVIVNQLLKTHTPDAIRILLARHHYRTPWEFFSAEMDEAQQIADRFVAALAGDMRDEPVRDPMTASTIDSASQWLHDDLQTPSALAALDQLAKAIIAGDVSQEDAAIARHHLRVMLTIMGIPPRHV